MKGTRRLHLFTVSIPIEVWSRYKPITPTAAEKLLEAKLVPLLKQVSDDEEATISLSPQNLKIKRRNNR